MTHSVTTSPDTALPAADDIQVAPGSVVEVRDEEWLVTGVERTQDGWLVHVQGLSGLVRDTTATFYSRLDDFFVLVTSQATVVADDSHFYRRSRLWLESTLRKTAVPLTNSELTVSTGMLADVLNYQLSAVRKALDPNNLRTRILLADAVGLGKTLEIGMILSELIRRGRGDRILIVCPRHVLEQMQHEMWCRFAIPFVRLDSLGIQRVRQKLPATRNPFTYFRRVIISIDTLKSDRYLNALRHHRWDAVVIDESHNLTNSETQNNRLARVLAPNTDALILASATPHNGRAESFAELIRLLEPTAVTPDGTIIPEEVERLVVRRHRHSPEVAREVGANWAERREPQNWLVAASPAENEVARELDEVWLHPDGPSPNSGTGARLFPWTLAKAFLSSPVALVETVRERMRRISDDPARSREVDALSNLLHLAKRAVDAPSGKYTRLVEYLRSIGVGRGSAVRAVVFAERIATLRWLQDKLPGDLKLRADQVAILHGGLTDEEQQAVVESFKQASSPIRVLVTGDVASEGVNLHTQCNELIHFDIPWSLIRIEQRNGRIDRYGQRKPPQITTLLLDPDAPRFAGDLRVLSRLIEREHEAHGALGDVASLMGKYDVRGEEDEIRRVLAGEAELDDVVAPSGLYQLSEDPVAQMLALLGAADAPAPAVQNAATQDAHTQDAHSPAPTPTSAGASALYPEQVDFLREALQEAFVTPTAPPSAGGLGWLETAGLVQMEPPADLRQRLEVLPQSYLAERQVTSKLTLVTSRNRGAQLLADALAEDSNSSWPEAHYLGPLHPVLDWASDRALASLARNQVFAVRGHVDAPTVLLLGTLTNRRGQVVSSVFLSAEFPNPTNPGFCLITPHASAAEMVSEAGLATKSSNPGPVAGASGLSPLVTAAVRNAEDQMRMTFDAHEADVRTRVDSWSRRAAQWSAQAAELVQRETIRQRRLGVEEEERLAQGMMPDRQLVRPLLVVLPGDHPVAAPQEAAS